MATGARVIQNYKAATHRKRIDIICENYSCMENIINAATIGLKRILIEEVEDMRHKGDSAELGVHVKNKGVHSDPTCRDGIMHASVEDAIIKCDFSGGMIEGIVHEGFVIERAETLRLMRLDLVDFNAQLECLNEEEKDVFLPYINKDKSLDDVAADIGVEYKSALQRLRRIKVKIDEGMHPLDFIA